MGQDNQEEVEEDVEEENGLTEGMAIVDMILNIEVEEGEEVIMGTTMMVKVGNVNIEVAEEVKMVNMESSEATVEVKRVVTSMETAEVEAATTTTIEEEVAINKGVEEIHGELVTSIQINTRTSFRIQITQIT